MPIISLRDVTKEFGESGSKHLVIAGVDLDVPAGAYLSIMGRSGSGKSTRLSVWENVAVPLVLRRSNQKESPKARALTELERFGLADFANHRPMSLSGGQQQRVAIARALVTQPELVLADEPTGNLDEESAAGVLDSFTAIRRDHDSTLVVVTHDDEVARHAELHLEMSDGRLKTNEPM